MFQHVSCCSVLLLWTRTHGRIMKPWVRRCNRIHRFQPQIRDTFKPPLILKSKKQVTASKVINSDFTQRLWFRAPLSSWALGPWARSARSVIHPCRHTVLYFFLLTDFYFDNCDS